jgi:hypothetical protein
MSDLTILLLIKDRNTFTQKDGFLITTKTIFIFPVYIADGSPGQLQPLIIFQKK